ncbi:MAG: TonB-dependent receptor [Deltaproteobacteria bacterium]|nr:TonB-dependent receptor [Deltaproteobacteria bacterium]
MLKEIVVTATRTSQDMSKVTSSVSVLNREEIEQIPAQNALDLLRNMPGITVGNVRGEYGSSSNNRTIIRGMGSSGTLGRVLILVDGMLAVSPDTGIFEWNSIDVDTIERIEVLRGPSSALYGSNAMGGVINIITRKPDQDGFQTKVTSKFGSYNLKNGAVYHTGVVGHFNYTVSVGYREADGFNVLPRHAPIATSNVTYARNDASEKIESKLVNLKAGYKLDDSFDINVDYSFNDYKNTGRFRIPNYNLYSMRKHSFSVQLRKKFGDVDSILNFRTETAETDYDTASGMRNGNDSPNQTLSYFVELVNTMNLGANNIFTFGLSGSYGKLDRQYHYFLVNRYRSKGGEQSNLAAFLQDQISLWDGKIQIVPGMRFDYWLTEGYDQDTYIKTNPGQINYPREIDKSFTGKIGVNINPWNNLVIFRTNFGQAYRVANLNDRYGGSASTATGNNITLTKPNPYLKPEKSLTLDFGVEINPLDILSISLTGYQTEAKNFITTINGPPEPPYVLVREKVNMDRVRIKGLEASVKLFPTNYLSFFAEGEINDSKITAGPSKGYHLTDTPESKFSIGATFSDPNLFTLRVSALRMGKIWVDQDPNHVEGDSWVGDLRLSRRVDFDKFWIEPFVEMSNITGRKELRYSSYSRLPINTFYGGLSIGF